MSKRAAVDRVLTVLRRRSNESHAVFDLTNIVPFVQQHKQDPTTGQPMTLKDITKLHFHRLDSGKYGCPITFKVREECARDLLLAFSFASLCLGVYRL